MSMKRSHAKSQGTRRSPWGAEPARSPFGQKLAEPEPERTWEELVKDQPEEAFQPYSLQGKLEPGALVLHTKFGKGAVVAVSGATADVVFEEGKKRLGRTP